MDNQPHDQIPPLELPRPETDDLPVPQEAFPGLPTNEIDSAMAVEQNIPAFPAPLMPQDNTALPSLPGPAGVNNVTGSSAGSTPAIADDTDLIEKEWVEKAKEIVRRTKDDPHAQTDELNKMKADYLKKRYNKELKLSEE